MSKIVCLRLKESTVAVLNEMAKVDKMDMEIRLSEIVEDLVDLFALGPGEEARKEGGAA